MRIVGYRPSESLNDSCDQFDCDGRSLEVGDSVRVARFLGAPTKTHAEYRKSFRKSLVDLQPSSDGITRAALGFPSVQRSLRLSVTGSVARPVQTSATQAHQTLSARQRSSSRGCLNRTIVASPFPAIQAHERFSPVRAGHVMQSEFQHRTVRAVGLPSHR